MLIILLLTLSLSMQAQDEGKLPSAPDFTLTDTQGNTWNLFEQLNAGKTVVLDFFSTTCGSCISSVPYVNQLWIDYGSGNGSVLVWAIETNNADNAQIDTFMVNYGGQYTVFSTQDNDSVLSLYEVTYTPKYFVICPDKMLQSSTFNELLDKIGVCQALNRNKENVANTDVIVFPNPGTDNINFEFRLSSAKRISKLKIFNIMGEQLASYNLNNENNQFQLNIFSLNRGLFFYIAEEDGIAVFKGNFEILK